MYMFKCRNEIMFLIKLLNTSKVHRGSICHAVVGLNGHTADDSTSTDPHKDPVLES